MLFNDSYIPRTVVDKINPTAEPPTCEVAPIAAGFSKTEGLFVVPKFHVKTTKPLMLYCNETNNPGAACKRSLNVYANI
jgi:hypothetical protein